MTEGHPEQGAVNMTAQWMTRAETSADDPAIRDIVLAAFESPAEAISSTPSGTVHYAAPFGI